ncbi:MAG: D-alanyl-D-alanine dipeptidase [Melioribacteraceae bacterium]|nr:MAG: D-alanyl-D-alanine dipeptidase [Melioribacteraceae bacterium]
MKKLIFILLVVTGAIFAQHDTSIVYLGDIDSTILTDVKYATSDNFTGKVLYPTAKVYTRKIVGEALASVNEYLKSNYGYTLKVFDAFRPLSVQKQMWEIFPDPNYVADPKTGSRHNRGAAVDLTIVDENGNELDMGTPYDDFTEKAHFAYPDLTDEQRKNRDILNEAMSKYGFTVLKSEWWHFDYKDWKNYSIIDFKLTED